MTREAPLNFTETIEAYLGQDALAKTEPLTRSDAELIGYFVQTFNFIEYNLRRAIKVFAHAGLIKIPKNNPRPSEIVNLVKSGVSMMSLDIADAEAIRDNLDDIELHRDTRNHLAHWAAKRVKGHDALFMLSIDDMDATRRIGSTVDHKSTVTCILNLADLRGLMIHISKQEKWLAELTSKWLTTYS